MTCIIGAFLTNCSRIKILVGPVDQTGINGFITLDDDIERAAHALKAMSHPLRLKILCAVGESELAVQDIVDRVGTSQSNVSQHLAKLKSKEILTTRRDANHVYYRVYDERILQLVEMMRDVFCSTEEKVDIN